MSADVYDNPLVSRYASREMAELWGPRRKFTTWRRLWIALAEAQQELGLRVSNQQVQQLRQHADNLNLDKAAEYERRLRHDVMAHVHAFGDLSPAARDIIHWGATSCYVTDNADLILLREALQMIRSRLVAVIDNLAAFAAEHRALPCLAFTHMQPAQPTTVGKRACLWAYDLVQDFHEVEHRLQSLCARSTKGTTGTQASFLRLFAGDHEKVLRLEQRVAEKIGFEQTYAVTGQTYPRKVDQQILDAVSGIAASAHKIATDVRLLAHRKELEEPFEKDQIGSSAMAYKRNPMRSERICGLARFVMSLSANAAQTQATQWMERTLDDSANRRLVLPQAFLGIDAVLLILNNVSSGLVVYPAVIERHLSEELPFMATENILMAAVAAGGDRQQLHECLRRHSQAAAAVVKNEGGDNDLLERLAADPAFAGIDVRGAAQASTLVGRAPEQVDEFIRQEVAPLRRRFPQLRGRTDELKV